MASSERYFDPKALARIGRLELRVRTVVEGIISGLHRSPYNGQSVEFVDHREYVPGDDPRHIDWKVLGRADRIVIKRYEEDTNLRGHLLLDASESMRFGQGVASRDRLSKYDYAATMAASMGYLLRRQHDAIGISLFDSEIRERVALSTNPATLHQVAEAMERTRPSHKTGLEKVLRQLADDIPRRGLVVLFSDLFAPLDEIEAGLRHFVVRRHDIVVFHTLDETELTFPFEGNTLFKGLEDYPEVLVEPRGLRDAYLEAMGNYLDKVRDICAELGVDYRLIHNGEPVDVPIISIVSKRARLGRRMT
jgi:uncharacterized protein (DUF58 family)